MNSIFNDELTNSGHSIEDIEIYFHENEYRARYYNMELTSAFQPIFSFAHKEPIGYEALLRISHVERGNISPIRFFSMFDGQKEISLFDHLLCTLHLKNFKRQFRENTWLFLNVRSKGIDERASFVENLKIALQEVEISPSQLVIEIVEDEIKGDDVFDNIVAELRQLGCLMALDDFGAGSSNFDRIWKISPDIIKLDRTMLTKSCTDQKARFILQELVPLIHGCNSYVLMEGIETEEEARVSMQMNADFMQGYLFGKPQKEVLEKDRSHITPIALCKKFQSLGVEQSDYQKKIGYFKNLFAQSADALFAEQSLETAFFRMLKHDAFNGCYVLDHQGNRVETLPSKEQASQQQVAAPGDTPLAHAEDTSWSRRPYFRNAITRPGEIVVSRPYLSLTKARRCITISIAWPVNEELHVICCDLDIVKLEEAEI